MDGSPEPRLAPPGAGLPLPELLVARALFAMRRRFGSHGSFTASFVRERAAVATLVRSCGDASATRRTLIARARGLEDSSRHWSAWMTLDHLRIVHVAIADVVRSLCRGVVPPGAASTAAVKPSPDADASVVVRYEESCDRLLDAVATRPDLRTAVRYAHPWFGPLDASGWHALAGMHLRIHRVQIERILATQRAEEHARAGPRLGRAPRAGMS